MNIRQWDVGGDSFDSLGGIGILEVADLSPLISSPDEPELQAVSFGLDDCGLMLWMRMKQMRK